MELTKFEEAQHCLNRIKHLKRLKELLKASFEHETFNMSFQVNILAHNTSETILDALNSLMPRYVDTLTLDDFNEILKSIDSLITIEEEKFKNI
jgi:hypothetical protein